MARLAIISSTIGEPRPSHVTVRPSMLTSHFPVSCLVAIRCASPIPLHSIEPLWATPPLGFLDLPWPAVAEELRAPAQPPGEEGAESEENVTSSPRSRRTTIGSHRGTGEVVQAVGEGTEAEETLRAEEAVVEEGDAMKEGAARAIASDRLQGKILALGGPTSTSMIQVRTGLVGHLLLSEGAADGGIIATMTEVRGGMNAKRGGRCTARMIVGVEHPEGAEADQVATAREAAAGTAGGAPLPCSRG